MQKLVCEFIHATFKAKFQKFSAIEPSIFSAYSAKKATSEARAMRRPEREAQSNRCDLT